MRKEKKHCNIPDWNRYLPHAIMFKRSIDGIQVILNDDLKPPVSHLVPLGPHHLKKEALVNCFTLVLLLTHPINNIF